MVRIRSPRARRAQWTMRSTVEHCEIRRRRWNSRRNVVVNVRGCCGKTGTGTSRSSAYARVRVAAFADSARDDDISDGVHMKSDERWPRLDETYVVAPVTGTSKPRLRRTCVQQTHTRTLKTRINISSRRGGACRRAAYVRSART